MMLNLFMEERGNIVIAKLTMGLEIALAVKFRCSECEVVAERSISLRNGCALEQNVSLPEGWEIAGNFLICPKHEVIIQPRRVMAA